MTVVSGIRLAYRRRHVRVSPLAMAIGATLSGIGANPSFAQDAGLEEIVVTSRYREENIQTTPISISAFSGDELEVRSIENVEDIGSVVPNAYFRRNASNFGPNNTVGLRGLNQVDFSYAFEPTVGIYIDDVYHSTITGSDMDLVDLERVEVLRGPQGTLFGKNSIGGAIRLISKKPQGDDTGKVQVTVRRLRPPGPQGDRRLRARRGQAVRARRRHEQGARGLRRVARLHVRDDPARHAAARRHRRRPRVRRRRSGRPGLRLRAGSAAADRRAGRQRRRQRVLSAGARSITQDGTCELGKLGGTSSRRRPLHAALPADGQARHQCFRRRA